MLEKAFLLFCAAFWMGYGFFCFFWPETVAGFIGYQFNSADAIIEVLAMYGGLEFGLGCMFLYSALNPQQIKAGLLLVIFVIGGLALSRTLGFFFYGGEVTVYTYGGIFYEGISALIALLLLLRLNKKQPQ
jgi:hypothetical protein